MYIFGYYGWDVLCAGRATDSGPGFHSNLALCSRRLPPDGWWPLAVTGGGGGGGEGG